MDHKLERPNRPAECSPMRSMRRHDGAFRDASPPPRSRPAKWVADSLETIWLAAQDHRLVPVVPGDRFRSRALAYGKPCASQRCMHGLEGGVGTSSSEVFHAYPAETRAARFICGRPPTCKDWLGLRRSDRLRSYVRPSIGSATTGQDGLREQ